MAEYSTGVNEPLIRDDLREEKAVSPMDDSSTSLYLRVCFAFLAGVVAGACSIDDLSFVIGIIAAWNESMLNFLFPGLFFLYASKYTKL